ncbi:MAG: hypothetical protein AAGC46_04795 [Solirubrobacteraceae bacterium]|nr:hypothetical protein [Patulibacter sp.]
MTLLPLAHLGHWYESVAYAMPMIVIGGVLWYTSRKERLAGHDGEEHWDGEDDPQWDDDPRLRDDD